MAGNQEPGGGQLRQTLSLPLACPLPPGWVPREKRRGSGGMGGSQKSPLGEGKTTKLQALEKVKPIGNDLQCPYGGEVKRVAGQ